MKLLINMQGQEIALTDGNNYFHGYIHHNNELLYNERAGKVISARLQEASAEQLFKDINGAFQFLYLKDNQLFFSIDHFGGYTLFYKLSETGIEIFDNPMLFPNKSSLNDRALCSIMAAGFTLNNDTIFCDIKECMPGTLYKYDLKTGKLSSEVWFSYISTDSQALDPEELDSIVSGLFPDVSEGTYTLSLSGGIDSRFLFGCLIKREKPFQAFSFGSDLNYDKHIAKKLASIYNIPLTSVDFTPEVCRDYFTSKDIEFILNYCTFGRSLPNETDLIPSNTLNFGQDIICKGFGGDFLNGRYITPPVFKLKNFHDAVNYLYEKYFSQTCISSPSMKNMLYSYLQNSVQAIYKQNNKNIISTIEQWNLLHNERKYIVNTLAYYKAKDYKFYLPFYDRNLMTYMSKLRFADKTDQRAYFDYLRDNFFTGTLSLLKTTESLRFNFLAEYKQSRLKQLLSISHNYLRMLDAKKLRKRYYVPGPDLYADVLMLFTYSLQAKPYLLQKIGEHFTEINKVSSFLSQNECIETAKHLNWLAKQAIGQMNINGMTLCKIFFNTEFIRSVKQHLPDNLTEP